MPLDTREFTAGPANGRALGLADRRAPDRAAADRRLVAGWLFVVCGMLLVMVALGGATRLTGSGLSIMEWAPLSGALPPLNEAEWQRLFALYQQIPHYQLLNHGFGIDGFRQIFWLEWTHRLWGRLIGVVFLLPLLWLWWRGAIGRALLPKLALLFALGGLQGAVGWFMVASGFFPDSVAVAPVRLVVHLTLALVLYAALLWTGLSVLTPQGRATAPAGLRGVLQLCLGLVALTIVAGGFVAGLHAGLAYNTFPLMAGRLVPEGYATMQPFALNLVANIAAVQFDHRLLATLTLVVASAAAMIGLRAASAGLRRASLALGAAVAAQYTLGIATLLYVVPASLGTAHQAVAVLVLTAVLVALHAARPIPFSPDRNSP